MAVVHPNEGTQPPPAATLQGRSMAALRMVVHGGGTGKDKGVNREMLEDAFREIDRDDSGVIDATELVEALAVCGVNASKKACDAVLSQMDKDGSGEIDVFEFIEFFRNIEQLDEFGKKAETRATILDIVCNGCLLIDMLGVGALMMIWLKFDKEGDPDGYSIINKILYVCMGLLGLLIFINIILPALRFIMRPVFRLLKKREIEKERQRMAEERKLKGLGGGDAAAAAPPSPKAVPPPGQPAIEAPPPAEMRLNMALEEGDLEDSNFRIGSSYRWAGREDEFALEDEEMEEPLPDPAVVTAPARSNAGSRIPSKSLSINDGSAMGSRRPSRRSSTHSRRASKIDQRAAGAPRPPGTGPLDRYDPGQYRAAGALANDGWEANMNWSPLQLQCDARTDMAVTQPLDNGTGVGQLALGN